MNKCILIALCLLLSACSPYYPRGYAYYPEITNASSQNIRVAIVYAKNDDKFRDITIMQLVPESSIEISIDIGRHDHIEEVLLLSQARQPDISMHQVETFRNGSGKRYWLTQSELDAFLAAGRVTWRRTSRQLAVMLAAAGRQNDPACMTIDDNGDLKVLRPDELPWYATTLNSLYGRKDGSRNACANPRTLRN
jgi:hypothetical protein